MSRFLKYKRLWINKGGRSKVKWKIMNTLMENTELMLGMLIYIHKEFLYICVKYLIAW